MRLRRRPSHLDLRKKLSDTPSITAACFSLSIMGRAFHSSAGGNSVVWAIRVRIVMISPPLRRVYGTSDGKCWYANSRGCATMGETDSILDFGFFEFGILPGVFQVMVVPMSLLDPILRRRSRFSQSKTRCETRCDGNERRCEREQERGIRG